MKKYANPRRIDQALLRDKVVNKYRAAHDASWVGAGILGGLSFSKRRRK